VPNNKWYFQSQSAFFLYDALSTDRNTKKKLFSFGGSLNSLYFCTLKSKET